MARPSSSALRGFTAFSGMVCFIGVVSIAPRLSLVRDEDFTSIKYQHLKHQQSKLPPSDPGLVIAPAPKRIVPNSDTNPGNGTPTRNTLFRENDWIFDTGATTHVCTNRALLHSYSSYAYTRHASAVGHFGPNPIPIQGIGDCTLILPQSTSVDQDSFAGVGKPPTSGVSPKALGISNPFFNLSPDSSSSRYNPLPSNDSNNLSVVSRLTIHNVVHIPTAGINIISWSQLKRSKGLNLRLVDNDDGSIGIVNCKQSSPLSSSTEDISEQQIMRFVLRDGLYFLDQAKVAQ